jgi:hypothetical protein
MNKFVKFLGKAKGVITSKGGDVAQLAIAAATGDFKGALKEVGDILGADLTDEGKALSEEFKISIKEFELEHAKIEMADRDSAREMQSEALNQNDLFSKRFIYYLAAFWSVVGAAFVLLVFFVDIPEKNLRLVDTLEGFVLSGVVSTIIAFFYGGMNNKD